MPHNTSCSSDKQWYFNSFFFAFTSFFFFVQLPSRASRENENLDKLTRPGAIRNGMKFLFVLKEKLSFFVFILLHEYKIRASINCSRLIYSVEKFLSRSLSVSLIYIILVPFVCRIPREVGKRHCGWTDYLPHGFKTCKIGVLTNPASKSPGRTE